MKKPGPRPRACVEALAPYVPGRPIEEVERQFGISGAVKLASNENPLGASPKAVAAAREVLSDVNRYPDGSGILLRRALSAKFRVPVEGVVLSAGGSELIDLVVRTYVEAGEEVIVPEGVFRMFPVAVARSNGTLVQIPTRPGFRADLEAMKRRIGPETKIVAIANPNNPTGAYVTRDELESYFADVPPHVLTVLDEAYFEFAQGAPGYPDGLPFLAAGQAVLVLRTFSKIVGLAGLRIGYGFAPEQVASAIQKVREPFNTSSVAQAAALASLDDEEHRAATRALIARERPFVAEGLAAHGLIVHPSVANFLLVETPRPFGPLETEFARRGVIVRPMASWGYPNAFRVSIGTRAENTKLLQVVEQLKGAGLLEPEAAIAATTVTLR